MKNTKEKTGDIILNLILGVYSLFFALIILNILLYKSYSSSLWICYFAIFILIIGIKKKSYLLILSQLSILAIPDFLWTLDLIYTIITGNTLLNISYYMFQPNPLLSKIVALQHIITVPIGIYSMYLIKKDKTDNNKTNNKLNNKTKFILIFSIAEASAFFIASRILTPLSENINCAYSPCPQILNWGSYYPATWIINIAAAIIVSYFVLYVILDNIPNKYLNKG